MRAAVLFAFLWAGGTVALESPVRLGDNRLQSEAANVVLDVFTYRPLNCAQPSVLLVFHGNGRGASSYRNSAKPIADDACFVVYSPLFDKERFPSWSYHRGGLVEDGAFREDDDWTVAAVDDLIEWIRSREGSDAPIYLFGHSAGAQYLSRVAAYTTPRDVTRILLANPSTYVMPDASVDVPYGFRGFGDHGSVDAQMQAYLEAPITIYLGLEDTGEEDLTRNEFADRQGRNRLDRGRQTFEFAKRVASENGWDFGWTLVEAPGVGHTARGMLNADEFVEALGFAD